MAQKNIAKKAGFLASLQEFIGLLLLVLAIRIFFFGLYQVPTPSMETTMLVGERFFADKLSYFFRAPRRGEIISFNDPEFKYSSNPIMKLLQTYVFGPFPFRLGPDNWTKRIIGIPGDHVEGRVENGKPVVYVNGKKLDEPYINKYPLICVLRQDPEKVLEKIRREVDEQFGSMVKNQAAVERYIINRLNESLIIDLRSYDPSVSYEDQPFYRINEKLLTQEPMRMPGSLIRPDIVDSCPQEETESAIKKSPTIPSGENSWNGSDVFSIKLSENQYWCMGDNRLGSKDCRVIGPIKGEWILGRILLRIWSIDSNESWWIVDLIKHPIDFWKRVRWSRFFQMVH